ncbi:type I toxin-antitoxin system SymE family toxin [Flavobacterium bizetiae]|uniref:type I toxin-antitoxin system SymE family toxin n=1 Tax=Flavobacterium bizetiae TaxID=2704140 RepID=UPI0021E98E19|nr:type I toxin-antitoxin system SymE family toxin [Flavobacterium bizetiae]UTN03823.1 type I toxin-antitoxin system SymE family toxin [Flavobacterium bizetiae]
MKNLRKLKIYKKYQTRKYHKTVSIPEINLKGKWLEKLGFKIGLMVNIEQKEHKLIITVEKE